MCCAADMFSQLKQHSVFSTHHVVWSCCWILPPSHMAGETHRGEVLHEKRPGVSAFWRFLVSASCVSVTCSVLSCHNSWPEKSKLSPASFFHVFARPDCHLPASFLDWMRLASSPCAASWSTCQDESDRVLFFLDHEIARFRYCTHALTEHHDIIESLYNSNRWGTAAFFVVLGYSSAIESCYQKMHVLCWTSSILRQVAVDWGQPGHKPISLHALLLATFHWQVH